MTKCNVVNNIPTGFYIVKDQNKFWKKKWKPTKSGKDPEFGEILLEIKVAENNLPLHYVAKINANKNVPVFYVD